MYKNNEHGYNIVGVYTTYVYKLFGIFFFTFHRNILNNNTSYDSVYNGYVLNSWTYLYSVRVLIVVDGFQYRKFRAYGYYTLCIHLTIVEM